MNLYSSRLKIEETEQQEYSYKTNPIDNKDRVIEGDFYYEKPMTIRTMVTRKFNKSLCVCLLLTIFVTFVSYYTAMIYEAKLNTLDSDIVRLNSENQDLQAELDRYKSFNNVDNKLGKFNLLKKAGQVIEVTALNSTSIKNLSQDAKTIKNNFSWNIGY